MPDHLNIRSIRNKYGPRLQGPFTPLRGASTNSGLGGGSRGKYDPRETAEARIAKAREDALKNRR